MYVKKTKRKCSVRGCKNTDTFAISLTREIGNSVVICRSCVGKALGAIDDEPKEAIVPAPHTDAPPLFFNAVVNKAKKAEPVIEPASEPEPEVTEPEEPAQTEPEPESEVEGFVCPYCDKVCKTEQGLAKHIELKHKGDA